MRAILGLSMLRLFGALLLLTFAVATPAGAQTLPAADRAAIQTVINGQLAAFARDDADGAYAFTSSGIKGLFPTAAEFLAMVKAGYGALIRPRSVTFGEITLTPDGPLQKVFVTDSADHAWIAVYALEPLPEGGWLINGCVMAADGTPPI